MAWLSEMTQSVGLLPTLLAAPGLAALFAVPAVADLAFRRPPPEAADPADPGQRAAPLFAVRNRRGAEIEILNVDYPRSMRENEARPLHLRYVAAPGWRSAFARDREVRIQATVGGARLNLVPDPAHYAFRNDRIVARGGDGRGWSVSPQAEGDYRLHVRLEVEPADFPVARIHANGARTAGDDVSLPVTVYTRYKVSQATVDWVKAIGTVLGFLLTLPFLSGLVKWLLGGRGAPAAPAEGRAPRPRPRPRKRREP